MTKIQKFPNSRWRTDAILKIIFGYNSAPYCPIKTKIGMRRHTRTHTTVKWWKCQISKIQHGGRPPFWKSLYLHILAATCPNFTKLSMWTQIWPQATETTKKSEIRKFKMADGRGIKNHFSAITQLHVVPLWWNLEWGGNHTHTKQVRWSNA